MGLIQCAEECKFQEDGYCCFEKCGVVASTDGECPHYIPKLFNNGNSLFQTDCTNKL